MCQTNCAQQQQKKERARMLSQTSHKANAHRKLVNDSSVKGMNASWMAPERCCTSWYQLKQGQAERGMSLLHLPENV